MIFQGFIFVKPSSCDQRLPFLTGTQRGLLVRDGPELDAQEEGHDGPSFHDQIIKGSHTL